MMHKVRDSHIARRALTKETTMSTCSSRNKGHSCVFSDEVSHDIHVALSPSGAVLSRWQMVAQEVVPEHPNPTIDY